MGLPMVSIRHTTRVHGPEVTSHSRRGHGGLDKRDHVVSAMVVGEIAEVVGKITVVVGRLAEVVGEITEVVSEIAEVVSSSA